MSEHPVKRLPIDDARDEDRSKMKQALVHSRDAVTVYGIDFTSAPKKRKPITCLECRLENSRLISKQLHEWPNFEEFQQALQKNGPWIAGIDFPFGQARRFVETIDWPTTWEGYVNHVASMSREEFRSTLNHYREGRQKGDKEHRRQVDVAAKSISPQKLYGTPVGLMFFEGAPRLLRSGVTVPGMQKGDPDRIVVEAYPGVLARYLVGRRSYKQDAKAKQTREQYEARKDLLAAVRGPKLREAYGITVEAPDSLAEDPGADHLDALLCAVQAAWAWNHRASGYGAPADLDRLEGWIADPTLYGQ